MTARDIVNRLVGVFKPCGGCKYRDLTDTINAWCVLSYRSCHRNRRTDGECKPQAIFWEKK